jgi:nicotinate-nucleotide pyrophosphorylase (carboxylating)
MDREQLWLVIECALDQDTGQGDVTSMWALPPNSIARGRIIARDKGVLAGSQVAELVFKRVNALVAFTPLKSDGELMADGDELATVVGPAISVFTAERTALNLMGHMSGIATLTRRYVDAVRDTNAVIIDTLKSTPGLRPIDQWAVRLGGGANHHTRLDDKILIRSGHAAIAGGITAAVERVRQLDAELTSHLQMVIEVQTWGQLDEAFPLEPDRILLSGMSIQDIADAVKWVAGRVPLEVVGGVTLANVRAIAETGVDYIAVDALTQQAQALDLSLEIETS